MTSDGWISGRTKGVLAVALAVALVLAMWAPAGNALAQSATEDQYGEGETGTIRGTITEAGGSSIRVEGSSSPDVGGAAILELNEKTEIFFVRGGTVPATADDLRVGHTVDATFAFPEGQVPAIYPGTYDALEIFILPDGGGAPPEYPGTPPGDGQYDPSLPPVGGSGSASATPRPGGGTGGVLPDTGGCPLAALGVGGLLIGGGLLARRIVR